MSEAAKPPRTVRCPTCQGASVWSPDNPYKPFCSERCRLIDLGAWANEEYRVPVAENDALNENGPDSSNI
jgi:endogenous inhibitor of DNA gyrase (YacG/DUF329 family)